MSRQQLQAVRDNLDAMGTGEPEEEAAAAEVLPSAAAAAEDEEELVS